MTAPVVNTVFVPGTTITHEWLNGVNDYVNGQHTSDEINYTPPFTGGVTTTVENKLAETVSVEDFGAVGDGSTDDTTAIQAAIDYCIGKSVTLVCNGIYKISTLTIENVGGQVFHMTGTGTFLGMASGTYAAMLEIVDCTQVLIDGNMTFFGYYNIDYGCGILVYSTTNTGYCGKHSFYNINFSGISRAWQFGRSTEYDPAISEITVYGGNLYQVPQAAYLYGSQTVINFIGCQMITGTGGALTGVARRGIVSIGATATIQGGEWLITDVINGYLCEMQPVDSPTTSWKQYGQISFNGVVIESASQYCHIHNPNTISVYNSSIPQFQMIDCRGYHSQNAFAMIQVASTDYHGSIVVQDCNFYSGSVRSQQNVLSSSDTCNIYVDEHSFGRNYVQGLQGIFGGIAHFDWRTILIASNCNSQSIPATTNTTLKFQSIVNQGDLSHFANDYSTSTGIFTVPAGGFAEVEVFGSLRTNAPTSILGLYLSLNGSIVDYIPTMMGGAGNSGVISGSFSLYNLSEGDELSLVAYSASSATTNFGSYEQFIIKARR